MEKSPLPFMYCRNLPRLAAAFKIDLVDSMHRNAGHLNTVIIGKWEMVLGGPKLYKRDGSTITVSGLPTCRR